MEEYDINEHTHRFATWAASRTASVKNYRFTVANGRDWIESVADLTSCICAPENLPEPGAFDEAHRRWRAAIICASGNQITHSVAAKLINVYLKAAVVQCAFADLPKVKAVHPPIDRLFSENLRRKRNGIWRDQNLSWSQFNSEAYEEVMQKVRETVGQGEALWKIEAYWQGYQ